MIDLVNVSKKYGKNYAVKAVSLKLEKGEVVGFLGRNGAGKTTMMNMITGYISSTAGSISVDGYDVLDNPQEAKKLIGYLPEQPPLYLDLTVEEYLSFVCRIKKVSGKDIKKQANSAMEMAAITDVRKRLIGNLSKGYKQRVGLAQALCGNPQTIILDEPTTGLDPKQIFEFRNTIKALGKEHTVILSSHILNEVTDICKRVIIIHHGRVVRQDFVSNLSESATDNRRIHLRLTGNEQESRELLSSVHSIRTLNSLGPKELSSTEWMIESGSTDIRAELYEAIKRSNLSILMLNPISLSLEDIFMRLTMDGEETYQNGSSVFKGN